MENEKKEEDIITKAQKTLKKAEEEKQKKCAEEIQAILIKYGYKLGTTQPQIVFLRA